MKSFYFAIGLDLISYYENETHGSRESFQSRRSRLILRSVEKHFDVLFAYSVCMKAAFEAERERERARARKIHRVSQFRVLAYVHRAAEWNEKFAKSRIKKFREIVLPFALTRAKKRVAARLL